MADSRRPTQFDDVFLNLSKHRGRLRLHPSGLGWKSSSAATASDPFTVPASDIRRAIWTHAARGYALRIILRNGSNIVLDGFDEAVQDRVFASMKEHFNVSVENREHSLRGWNWGKARFEGNELAFQVGARNLFEIPLGKVSNTNLVGKTEVAVEFALPKDGEKKEFEHGDELVEIRFYVPGMKEKEKGEGSENGDDEDKEKEKKKEKETRDEDEGEDGDEDEEQEEVTAASV
jgi:structure-specific recognition protein 1